MFFKRNDKLDALIGLNSEFNGNLFTNGTLRIDGRLTGNITAEWVVIGENGVVKGDIKAKGVIIGGSIEGNINADELVDIKYTGKLSGDIHTRRLSVAEGGLFEGRSLIQKDIETKLIDFPAKEAAVK